MGGGQSTWQGYEHQLMNDKNNRVHEVPNSATEGTSNIYRSPKAPEGFPGFLKDDESKEDIDTAWKVLTVAARKFGDKPFFGSRTFPDPANNPKNRGDYRWLTYQSVYETVLSVGNGLQTFGLPEQSNIGIFASNRPEWLFVHFGNMSQSFRTVALYDTLGADAVAYIVAHAGLELIVVEKDKLKALFEAVKKSREDSDSIPDECKLRLVVQIDADDRFGNTHENVEDSDKQKAQELGLELLGLSEVIEKGKGKTDTVAPKADDLAYIMYTSGTTGAPKGVMLSHGNFAANVASAEEFLHVTPDDVHVSYLPMAHIFETMAITAIMFGGGKFGFFQGDVRKLGEDFKTLRPTILIGVPRVFSKSYDKFKLTVSQKGTIGQTIAGWAEASSKEAVRKGGRSGMYDSLVWNKASAAIGFDRCRLVISGAAPLSPYVAEFMRIVCPNASVIQGYGMTETGAGGTVVDLDDITLGHVGIPVVNTEVRLIDAPECNYFVTDKPCPRGEVQFRGLNIMKGYYKNDEATAKTIDKDGWLSTGDIGRINPNGTLSIIDRRKNMFKTSQGEYIAAERLETIYGKAATVNQIWVYGNSYKSFILAVVVPDALVIVDKFKESGKWPADDSEYGKPATPDWNNHFTQVAKDNYDQVKQWVAADLKQQMGELKSFEKIKDFHLELEIDDMLQGFNVTNDTMTPTSKLRRPQLLGRYAEILKQLYTDNGEPPSDAETWGS